MVSITKTMVPTLRFRDFTDSWKVISLGEACSKIQDGNYGESYPKASEFLKEGIPFLTSKAIGSDGTTNREKIDYICAEKHRELKKAHLALHDVLFTNRGANVGVIGFVEDYIANGNIGPQLTLLRANLKIITPLFLKYSMTTLRLIKQIRSQDSGSAMNFFGIGATSKFKLGITSLDEQEKITTFLDSIDEKLNKLRCKRELFKTYKRGLMRKFFSQKIRFKQDDGFDFPDWEEKRIDELYDWVGTNNLSRENLTLESGDVQNIHYGDIHSKFSSHFNQEIEEAPYIIDSNFLSTLNSNAYCKAGDLIIADASEDYKDIGKSTEIINVKPNSLVAGLHTYIARPKFEFALGFSGYLFQSEDVKEKIQKIAQGISVLGISKTNLNKIKVFIPAPKEQEKITGYLASIDQKIDAAGMQITQLETFKKGLLHKMFV